jgi:hypothetical protein
VLSSALPLSGHYQNLKHRKVNTVECDNIKSYNHGFLRANFPNLFTSWWGSIIIQDIKSVGFEVLIAVNLKSTNFWDVTPSNPVDVQRRFERRMIGVEEYAKQATSRQSWLTLSLKMEAIRSSETSANYGTGPRRYS